MLQLFTGSVCLFSGFINFRVENYGISLFLMLLAVLNFTMYAILTREKE